MKTKFAVAALAWLAISGAASANNITFDAGLLPTAPAAPYGHVFIHDASAFTDTIDFVVSTGSLGASANALNVKLQTLDVFNIDGLSYSVWGGTSAASTIWYGTFPGDNLSYDIGLSLPGAYHLVVTGMADGSSGGAYGVALVSGVPEPETYAMILAGFGILGVVARRRKSGKTTV
jgi:multidrug transporter EmrE-like cation transporter